MLAGISRRAVTRRFWRAVSPQGGPRPPATRLLLCHGVGRVLPVAITVTATGAGACQVSPPRPARLVRRALPHPLSFRRRSRAPARPRSPALTRGRLALTAGMCVCSHRVAGGTRDAEEEERCGTDDPVLIHARNHPDEEVLRPYARGARARACPWARECLQGSMLVDNRNRARVGKRPRVACVSVCLSVYAVTGACTHAP